MVFNPVVIGLVILVINLGFIYWFHKKRIEVYKEIQFRHMLKLEQFSKVSKIAMGFMHDISNPLTAVILQIELLSKEKSQKNQEIIQILQKNVSKMEQILLSGRQKLHHQSENGYFFVLEELDQIIFSLETKAKQQNVALFLDIHFQEKNSDAPIMLRGDPIIFAQIITPIISNAIDAYDQSEKVGIGALKQAFLFFQRKYYKIRCKDRTVEVSVQYSNKISQIVVRDWGSGISLEGEKNLFEPLYSTKRLDKGLGIGLFLSKSMLEQYFDGDISYQTRNHLGTCFKIDFPNNSCRCL